MVQLENSNEILIEGLVSLVRDELGSEFSTNSEYSVPNVWGKNLPSSAEDEFPRATIDTISGDDFELSVDLDVALREVTVKFVVFAETDAPAQSLPDDIEDVIREKWDQNDPIEGTPYLGDWTFREVDGFTELNESGEQEGNLRYSRSIDGIFETIKN
jgi:hypothetical protein